MVFPRFTNSGIKDKNTGENNHSPLHKIGEKTTSNSKIYLLLVYTTENLKIFAIFTNQPPNIVFHYVFVLLSR